MLFGLAFQVIGRRGGAQYHGTGVFFFFRLESIDLFGHFPGANDEQAGSQRIKRACMANF